MAKHPVLANWWQPSNKSVSFLRWKTQLMFAKPFDEKITIVDLHVDSLTLVNVDACNEIQQSEEEIRTATY